MGKIHTLEYGCQMQRAAERDCMLRCEQGLQCNKLFYIVALGIQGELSRKGWGRKCSALSYFEQHQDGSACRFPIDDMPKWMNRRIYLLPVSEE
eukprot:3646184-Ditylum_brightwellii.AAC.1